MSEELKPCPFCGAQAFLKHAGRVAGGDAYYVECDNCEVGTKIDAEERVVAMWNRRTPEAAQ